MAKKPKIKETHKLTAIYLPLPVHKKLVSKAHPRPLGVWLREKLEALAKTA